MAGKHGWPKRRRKPSDCRVALRCPTYRENSHANHTWHQHPQETSCFIVPAAPSPWVRFRSFAPLFVVSRWPLSWARHSRGSPFPRPRCAPIPVARFGILRMKNGTFVAGPPTAKSSGVFVRGSTKYRTGRAKAVALQYY
jgi:hypothetical protein